MQVMWLWKKLQAEDRFRWYAAARCFRCPAGPMVREIYSESD